MEFKQNKSEIFVPDDMAANEALARTTHLAIGAHQDDLEIMAIDGILQCFNQNDKWFTGVVMTDGKGSPSRGGVYAGKSDWEMVDIRVSEQKKAAVVGNYAAQIFLYYHSSAVKDGANQNPVTDLETIFQTAKPEVVYTHNLADKHPTHIGVAVKTIQAIRNLPTGERPKKLYGCEVWRTLDWVMDEEKVLFNCSDQINLQSALIGIFDSQINGGKRYDQAIIGRRVANATFLASHFKDEVTGLSYAMDLTPLIHDPDLDIEEYIQGYISRFAQDVKSLINSVL